MGEDKITALVEFQQSNLKLQEAEEGESKKRTLEGVVAELGIVNANRRLYSEAVYKKAIKEIQADIKAGNFTGELDHPYNAAGFLERTAFKFTKVFIEDKLVKFEAEILDTPAGNTLRGLLEGGVQVGISSRGTGSVKWVEDEMDPENYIAVIQDDFKLLGADAVKTPSNPAGMMKLRESLELGLVEKLGLTPEGANMKTLAELRAKYPELVKEAEEVASNELQAKLDEATAKLETQATELAEAAEKVTKLEAEKVDVEGKLAETQTKISDLNTKILGEGVSEDGSLGDLSTAVSALTAKLETIQEDLDATKASNASLMVENAFAKVLSESKFSELIAKQITDLKVFESVEALNTEIGRITKIAESLNVKTSGKGVVESETEEDTLAESVVTAEMLVLAGVQASS